MKTAFVLFAALAAILPAQQDPTASDPLLEQVQKLRKGLETLGPQVPAEKLDLLKKELAVLERLLQDRIDRTILQAQLKQRQPEYRLVKVKTAPAPVPAPAAPAPGPVPGTAEGETKPPAADTPAQGDEVVLLRADGMAITRGETQALADYLHSFQPDLAPEQAQRQALEHLIVRAHVAAAYKDKLPEMRKRIEAIRARIVEKQEIFADVAAEASDCPSKADGGNLGAFGRGNMVEPFGMHAFTTKKGEVSPVFLSPFGYHILKVTEPPMGPEPREAQVKARHILVIFDQDSNRLRGLIAEAKSGKAQVEVVEPSAAALVPDIFRRR